MATGSKGISVGHVLYLHDVHDTGFSSKSIMRWWIVIAITGQRVRIAPRSASTRRGVEVPETAMSEFTKAGRVPRYSMTISMRLALHRRNIGPIPREFTDAILAQFLSDPGKS